MADIIQVVGALCVLTGFILVQAGRVASSSRRYLLLNLVGAGILAADAAIHAQPGFLLLEGTWALVAGASLVLSMRSDRRRVPLD